MAGWPRVAVADGALVDGVEWGSICGKGEWDMQVDGW